MRATDSNAKIASETKIKMSHDHRGWRAEQQRMKGSKKDALWSLL